MRLSTQADATSTYTGLKDLVRDMQGTLRIFGFCTVAAAVRFCSVTKVFDISSPTHVLEYSEYGVELLHRCTGVVDGTCLKNDDDAMNKLTALLKITELGQTQQEHLH